MADWSELEQLAAAATKGVWEVDPEEIISPHSGAVLGVYIRHQKKGGRIAEFFANCLVKTDEQCRANARFAAAANPSVILALIAENKQLISAVNSECNDWAQEYVRRKQLAAERDQLRAEVEALRKDAERYRYLREECDLQWDIMYEYVELQIQCDLDGFDSLDDVVDASMNKEVAHG